MEATLDSAPDEDDDLVHIPSFRRMPHNIEAEMQLLGAILVKPRALEGVSTFLSATHFALAEHRAIYSACIDMVEEGHAPCPVRLKSVLDGRGSLDMVGGPAYLNRLIDCAVTPTAAILYGRLVHDLAVRRDMIAIGEEVVAAGHDMTAVVDVDGMSEYLRSMRRPVPADMSRFDVQELDALDLPEDDEILGSWLHSRSIVMLAGPKKSGKTFLLTQIARAVVLGEDLFAWKSHRPARVLYLDYEVGWKLLRKRRFASYGRYARPHGLKVLSYDMVAMPRLDTPEGVTWLASQIEAVKAEVVIIDNLGKVTTETVNDDTTAKRLARAYSECHRRGCGVIIGHHTGHDVSRAAGSSVFLNDITGGMLVTRDPDADLLTVDLEWADIRDGGVCDEEFAPIRLQLDRETMCLEICGGVVKNRPAKAQEFAHKLLVRLIGERGVQEYLPPPAPPGVFSIGLPTWRTAYIDAMPGARQLEADKEMQAMVKAGAVGCWRDSIWLA